ncbi:MAG: alkaline phosphatase family protein [Gemmatimonadota bacterium]|nr:alkaline phosphatase family protein [Gemmatimonadota bacterium]
MKRWALAVLAGLILLRCMGDDPETPRLMVVLVVDQMRGDYIERFGDQWVGGLARIVERGAVFTDAVHDHAATVTAVGHATVPTGVVPARHGIVWNDFFDRSEGRVVYPPEDAGTRILGAPRSEGRSPHRLRRSGLSDWVKDADADSRVYSLSLKDVSAIMMGGTGADAAFWVDRETERVVTSTYYMSDMPDWVESHGSRDRIASIIGNVGSRTLGAALRDEVSPWDEISPPDLVESEDDRPFVDEVTLLLARAAVERERLGHDDTPDVLFLGISASDFVGHRFGPDSDEVRDFYLELDRYLGEFFEFLDRQVGKERWSLVLTADHGVGPTPEETRRRGGDARRIPDATFESDVRAAARAAASEADLDDDLSIRWLDGPFLRSEGASDRELRRFRRAFAERLAEIDWIEWAFPSDEVTRADPRGTDPIDWFGRSYDADRSPDVLYSIRRNHLVGSTTASHGTPHYYDRHVPIVFMGPGIHPGVHDERVRTVDIAPTVAALLGVKAPGDLDGRVLRRVLPWPLKEIVGPRSLGGTFDE